jgi:hypothetical protein
MAAKLSKDDVLVRFHEKHGNTYDYSDIEYAGTKSLVNVRCRKHDKAFSVTPENHFRRGDGCPLCGRERQIAAATKPFQQFVEEARELHGDVYTYNETSYSGARKNMQIQCSAHGWFEQLPMVHLRGAGCRKCADEIASERKTLSQTEYDERLLKKYAGKISGKYSGMHNASLAICEAHGSFTTTPHSLLQQKYGCPECAHTANKGRLLLDGDEVVERLKELFGDKYDYSQVNYEGSDKKITLICSQHGEFNKLASKAFNGEGCPKCAYSNATAQRTQSVRNSVERTREKRKQSFITRATETHQGFFDYSKVDFVNMRTLVIITCPIHGDFDQIPGTHISAGCRKCADAELKGRYTETYFERYPDEGSRPATLYYVKINALGETFYKVGITVTTVSARFANLKGIGAEVSVLATQKIKLREAFDREQVLLKSHASKCPFRPKLSESKRGSIVGATECFSKPLTKVTVQNHYS